MNYAKRIAIATIITISCYSVTYENTTGRSKLLTFNDLKHFISYYESLNGQFKFNKRNRDGTVDCGLYQINSSHFRFDAKARNDISGIFDSLFTSAGISRKINERIVEAIRNDSLNFKFATILYNKRGITQWSSYKYFKQYLEGYRYHVGMSTLSKNTSATRRQTLNKRVDGRSNDTNSRKVLRQNKVSNTKSTISQRQTNNANCFEVSLKNQSVLRRASSTRY
jgi:hypothetical protein